MFWILIRIAFKTINTCTLSRGIAFPTILHVGPAKTQISLRACAQADQSLRCAPEDALDLYQPADCRAKTLISQR